MEWNGDSVVFFQDDKAFINIQHF